VVYPLVEESEKLDLESATEGFERLQAEFKGHQVGLLHGRMKADEKEAVMALFRAGEVQILVATTVVEVGVDVPNATVMLIESSERFGLSQLHQLRGRVGRGAHASQCLLVANTVKSQVARERLETMEQSTDGFVIAQKDLDLRGPGEFLGTRQSGLPELSVANLARDQQLLVAARKEAQLIVERDPRLKLPEHAPLLQALRERWEGKLDLSKVG
jgi:ATP-dependent DNA helicase RecG